MRQKIEFMKYSGIIMRLNIRIMTKSRNDEILNHYETKGQNYDKKSLLDFLKIKKLDFVGHFKQ